MATHSSVLAWRIPGTVEPGGWRLLSMGSHRVGHDLSDLAAAAAATDGETEVLWDRKFDFHKKNEVISVQADLGSTEAQRAMPHVYLERLSALAALTLPRMEKLIEMDHLLGFPVVKTLCGNARDSRDAYSIPGSGRYPGRGHGNPLHYSGLENPMDREAWWATVHRVTKSQT